MRSEKYILFLVMFMQRSIFIDVFNTHGQYPVKGLVKGSEKKNGYFGSGLPLKYKARSSIPFSIKRGFSSHETKGRLP